MVTEVVCSYISIYICFACSSSICTVILFYSTTSTTSYVDTCCFAFFEPQKFAGGYVSSFKHCMRVFIAESSAGVNILQLYYSNSSFLFFSLLRGSPPPSSEIITVSSDAMNMITHRSGPFVGGAISPDMNKKTPSRANFHGVTDKHAIYIVIPFK